MSTPDPPRIYTDPCDTARIDLLIRAAKRYDWATGTQRGFLDTFEREHPPAHDQIRALALFAKYRDQLIVEYPKLRGAHYNGVKSPNQWTKRARRTPAGAHRGPQRGAQATSGPSGSGLAPYLLSPDDSDSDALSGVEAGSRAEWAAAYPGNARALLSGSGSGSGTGSGSGSGSGSSSGLGSGSGAGWAQGNTNATPGPSRRIIKPRPDMPIRRSARGAGDGIDYALVARPFQNGYDEYLRKQAAERASGVGWAGHRGAAGPRVRPHDPYRQAYMVGQKRGPGRPPLDKGKRGRVERDDSVLGLESEEGAHVPAKPKGSGRYVCPIRGCGKRFKSASGIEYHVTRSRFHRQDRPNQEKRYACPVDTCGKVYPSSSALKNHLGTHGTWLACPIPSCCRVYQRAAGLNHHLAHGTHGDSDAEPESGPEPEVVSDSASDASSSLSPVPEDELESDAETYTALPRPARHGSRMPVVLLPRRPVSAPVVDATRLLDRVAALLHARVCSAQGGQPEPELPTVQPYPRAHAHPLSPAQAGVAAEFPTSSVHGTPARPPPMGIPPTPISPEHAEPISPSPATSSALVLAPRAPPRPPQPASPAIPLATLRLVRAMAEPAAPPPTYVGSDAALLEVLGAALAQRGRNAWVLDVLDGGDVGRAAKEETGDL